jgi:uncharacterized membrane protein
MPASGSEMPDRRPSQASAAAQEDLDAKLERLRRENQALRERAEASAAEANAAHRSGQEKPSKVYPSYKRYVGGAAMVGTGVTLMALGGAFIPFTLGTSGFALTGGIILLIIGVVLMVRAKHS